MFFSTRRKVSSDRKRQSSGPRSAREPLNLNYRREPDCFLWRDTLSTAEPETADVKSGARSHSAMDFTYWPRRRKYRPTTLVCGAPLANRRQQPRCFTSPCPPYLLSKTAVLCLMATSNPVQAWRHSLFWVQNSKTSIPSWSSSPFFFLSFLPFF